MFWTINDIEAALLRARGYTLDSIDWIDPRTCVATATKRTNDRIYRAQAVGLSESDAIAKVVGVVVRP